MSNWIPQVACRNATVAVPLILPEIEVGSGDILHLGILIEALNGAPTAATLAAKFQVCPIEANANVLNAETDTAALPWFDVAAADGLCGPLLLDGDFPSPLADQTYVRTASGGTTVYPAGVKMFERRIRGGALGRLIRCVLTPTFTGGTSPSWTITAAAAVQIVSV
ncbi:MAG: hypothetical protein JWR59_606 [Brevundimonas sp.]|nr:hypothetical protein [Brevundimonas sp.]